MTVTVITVCAADRRHIYSSPKAIPHPLNPLNLLHPLNLHAQRVCPCLPADWYLSPIVSNAACTEILRLRLRMTVPGGKSRNADFILIAKGDTTTLSRKVAVKLQNLKNLRGGAPSTFSCEPGSPRGLYHSSSPQGSSEMLSRRMYTFSVSYSICSDQRVTARMRSWVRAHSRRMKVTLSRL